MAALAAVLVAGTLHAQTFRGQALDTEDDRPLPTTLVRLVTPADSSVAVTAADSAGFWSLEAPTPGVYRLVAERIGYDPFRTPLLEAQSPDGVYPIDLMMKRAPIPIRGFTVSAQRVQRQLHLVTGVNPRSLRKPPIEYAEIQRSLEMGRSSLSDLLRWSSTPSLQVFRTVDGPCFSLRGSGCLSVYFNGMHYRQEILDVVPLDMVYTVVLLYPGETMHYPSGAVLLFSEAWIR